MRAYFETFGLPVTITNCSNNYGPFQFPEKVIPLFTTNAIDDEPLPMYASTQNNASGCTSSTTARRSSLVLRDGRAGETYNVGSEVEATIEEIADRVLELTGKPSSLKKIVPDRPGHDRRYLLDASKLEGELGWTASRGWDEGRRDGRLVRGEPRVVGAARSGAPVEESAWNRPVTLKGARFSAENRSEPASDRSLTPALIFLPCGATWAGSRALFALVICVLTVAAVPAAGQQGASVLLR